MLSTTHDAIHVPSAAANPSPPEAEAACFPPLTLPDELCDLILSLALRRFGPALLAESDIASALLPTLHALPRATAPLVARAALMRLTWIDLDVASRLANTWLLDLMLQLHPSARPLVYSPDWFDQCAEHGLVDVLQWWWDKCMLAGRGRPNVWASVARVMDVASAFGQVEVLDWCVRVAREQRECAWTDVRASDLWTLGRWSEEAMDAASAMGHVHVLEWWWSKHQSAGWQLKFSDLAFRNAPEAHVLDWWFDRVGIDEIKIKLPQGIPLVSVHLLDWWDRQPKQYLPLVFDCDAITTSAIRANDFAVVKWVIDQGIWRAGSEHVLLACTHMDRVKIQVVEECIKSLLLLPEISGLDKTGVLSKAVIAASTSGRADILDLIEAAELVDFSQSELLVDALVGASQVGHVHVLDWWCRRLWLHKHPILVNQCMQAATRKGCFAALDWWRNPFLWLNQGDGGATKWAMVVSCGVNAAVTACEGERSIDVVRWWVDLCSIPRVYEAVGHVKLCSFFSAALVPALEHGWTEYIEWAHAHAIAPFMLTVDANLVQSPLAMCLINGHLPAFLAFTYWYHGIQPEHIHDGRFTDWTLIGVHNLALLKHDALQSASNRGDLSAMEWIHKIPCAHPLEGYSGITLAALHGHAHVVQWWLESGLRIKESLPWTLVFRDPFIFDLWTRTGGPSNGTLLAMQDPGSLSSFFFRTSGGYAKSLVRVHLLGDCRGRIAGTTNRGCQVVANLGNSDFAVAASHEPSRIQFLEWWLACKSVTLAQRRKWSKGALQETKSIDVLNWWKWSGIDKLEVPDEESLMDMAEDEPELAQWWRNSGLIPGMA